MANKPATKSAINLGVLRLLRGFKSLQQGIQCFSVPEKRYSGLPNKPGLKKFSFFLIDLHGVSVVVSNKSRAGFVVADNFSTFATRFGGSVKDV